MVMVTIPRVPHWRGRRRVVGEVKSLPVKLARCLPPPAVRCLLCSGLAVPAQSTSEGAGCPWEGAGRAAVPISACTQAGKCRQGPGVAGICPLGTHGEKISPTAPLGVPGRSRQGGKGNGSSQGISGGQALPESCGIAGDVCTAWLRAAGRAQSEWGTPSQRARSVQRQILTGFRYQDAFGCSKSVQQKPELSLPPLPGSQTP